MIEIIQEAHHEKSTEHRRQFEPVDRCNGSFYSFPCDAEGNCEPFACPEAAINYTRCLQQVTDGTLIDKGVQSWGQTYFVPAVGRCHCGTEITLDSFTCTCDDCGRDYNQSGQELAPRWQWGEETGESLSDILRVK